MTQKQLDDLYGNVVEHRSNNVFAVALNIGDECDATVPKPVAREAGEQLTIPNVFRYGVQQCPQETGSITPYL